MKDGSLVFNTLASFTCSLTETSLKMEPTICQKWLTCKRLSVKQLQSLCSSNYPIWFKFRQRGVNLVCKELQRVFRLLMLAMAIEKWKSLNAKISVKS